MVQPLIVEMVLDPCCAMRYRLHDMSLEVPTVCDLAYDESVHSM